MGLRFTLNGDEIAPPKNWKELEVELNFDNNTDRLTTNDFEFLGSTATFINEWIENGCKGGVGMLEPPVFNVDEVCESGTFNILESVLDLRKAEFACDWTKTPIQELGNIDFLTEAADTFSLLLLIEELNPNEIGFIHPNELSEVYYVTLDVPDVSALLGLTLTTFGLVQETITTITAGIDAVIAFIGNYPLYLEGLGQIILNAIQTAILGIQTKILIDQVTEALLPFPRKHKALKAKVGFEKGCAYLGYKFSSTILDSPEYKNLCVIPKKTTQGVDVNVPKLANKQEATSQETFGDWIRDLSQVFNAKITVIGDTVHWERRDHFKSQGSYQVPNVLKEFSGTNADETDFNFVVGFKTDSADLQTFQQYDNSIYSHTVIPVVTSLAQTGTSVTPYSNAIIKNRLLMSGTSDKKFAFGVVGRRNDCANSLELGLEVLNTFVGGITELYTQLFNKWDIIGGLIAGPIGATIASYMYDMLNENNQPQPSFAELKCRKGFMLLATDYIGVKRLCILDEGEVANAETGENLIDFNNQVHLSAKYIWDNFHYIDSPAPLFGTVGNQWITYKGIEVPFTCEDFAEIKQQGHNYINYGGVDIPTKIDSLKFNPFNCTAVMDIRIQKKWTCNLDYKNIQQEPALIRDGYARGLSGILDAVIGADF